MTVSFTGLSKKPPKEDLVKKYQDQAKLNHSWQQNSQDITKIIQKLTTSYQHSKGGFAINRYEELKNMIKEAIQHERQLAQEMRTRPSGEGAGADTVHAGPTGESGQKVGLISRLRMNAMGFATHQDDLTNHQKDYTGLKCSKWRFLKKAIMIYSQHHTPSFTSVNHTMLKWRPMLSLLEWNNISTSGDAIWDRTLIGTVTEKAIFCFDSMMLLLHMVLSL